MTLSLAAWLLEVDGRRIDRDGKFPARDPYQCWDLWADYAERVEGAPILSTYTNAGGASPHPGYACNVFHNATRVPAISSRFVVLGPGALAAPGDVAFWEKGGLYAGSHVAIVTDDLGERLRCMSQNKGPGLDAAGYETLSKRTLLGYLRPRNKALHPTPTPDRPAQPAPDPTPTAGGFLVALTDQQQQELYNWTKGMAEAEFVPGTRTRWWDALNNKLDGIAVGLGATRADLDGIEASLDVPGSPFEWLPALNNKLDAITRQLDTKG